MSFAKFNRERLFDVDTTDYDYYSLEQLWEANEADTVYRVCGVYINTKSEFADESPLVATDYCYVNIPQHQLGEIKCILADKQAIRAIKDGTAGFKIVPYNKKRDGKIRTFYKAEWVDTDPTEED